MKPENYLLLFANILLLCAAGTAYCIGFHNRMVACLFATACLCCVSALIIRLKGRHKQ